MYPLKSPKLAMSHTWLFSELAVNQNCITICLRKIHGKSSHVKKNWIREQDLKKIIITVLQVIKLIKFVWAGNQPLNFVINNSMA